MREVIQSKLEEIENLEVTTEMADDILETEITYFSFTLFEDFQDSDLNNNFTYKESLIGYIKRLEEPTENTLEIVDKAREQIKQKLKELNIKSSFQDVSISNGIRKIKCTGDCMFNEINNLLV